MWSEASAISHAAFRGARASSILCSNTTPGVSLQIPEFRSTGIYVVSGAKPVGLGRPLGLPEIHDIKGK